jgi:hypothetical protein
MLPRRRARYARDVSWDARKQELAGELVRRLYGAGVIRTWLRDKPDGWELM